MSTESGIPDFRSTDGLYREQWSCPPEQIISRSFFERDRRSFSVLPRKADCEGGAAPGAAHLAALEAGGKLRAVVTQNIDGLHQAAGSKSGVGAARQRAAQLLHGVRPVLPGGYIEHSAGVPRCEACGGIVKPDVVLYEEPLDERVLEERCGPLRQPTF